MRKSIFFSFFFIVCQVVQSQIIPDSMRVDWRGAGYGSCLPNPSTILNIQDFGGAGDSITDNYPAIHLALDSLHGQPGVIWFPAGIYSISSTVSIPAGAILRGAGADSTKLKMKHSGYGFSFTGTNSGGFYKILKGYQKESRHICVEAGTGLVQGDFAEILETNGSWDSNPASWATDVVGQIVRITGVQGDTLLLEKPLRITYDSLLNPRIRKLLPLMNAGMESLKIFRDDTSKTASSYNISFEKAAYCWVKGVEGYISLGSHCMISLSTNIEVSGCYFHHANNYDGGGTRGYGVTLNNHAGQCLIENNIFRHVRHAMMTKCGANGNVFTYNYSVDPFRNGSGEFPADAGADISLHGHYSYANLFESNVVQTIYIDQTWGPSGPYNTIFRNRAELYGILNTSTTSNKENFVGNEVTNTAALHGMYTLSGSGHFQYGNMIRGTVTPAGTTNLNDTSYFYAARPDHWDEPEWSLIGIPYTPGTTKIPAQRRNEALQFTTEEFPVAAFQYNVDFDRIYFQNYSANTNEWLWTFGDGSTSDEVNPSHMFSDTGQFTVCLIAGNGCNSDTVCAAIMIIPTGIKDLSQNVKVYPNPVRDMMNVEIPKSSSYLINIELYDISGRCVKSLETQVYDTHLSLDLSGLADGVYSCKISGSDFIFTTKIIKIKVH